MKQNLSKKIKLGTGLVGIAGLAGIIATTQVDFKKIEHGFDIENEVCSRPENFYNAPGFKQNITDISIKFAGEEKGYLRSGFDFENGLYFIGNLEKSGDVVGIGSKGLSSKYNLVCGENTDKYF